MTCCLLWPKFHQSEPIQKETVGRLPVDCPNGRMQFNDCEKISSKILGKDRIRRINRAGCGGIIGPRARHAPWAAVAALTRKIHKFSTTDTKEPCVIRTTLPYFRKQNRRIRLDERYSDELRLICNDCIPVPIFCIIKIKRHLIIDRTFSHIHKHQDWNESCD